MVDYYKIYLITNEINGKKYVGFTSSTLEERFKAHIRSCQKGINYILYKAMRKYGPENFTIMLLHISSNKEHTLKLMEPYFIKEYDSFGKNGYNMTCGGDGVSGWKPTKEQIAANSLRNRGSLNPMYGKKRTHSEASKEKIKNSLKGKNNHRYGKIWSKEQRENIREGMRKYKYVCTFSNKKTPEIFYEAVSWCKNKKFIYRRIKRIIESGASDEIYQISRIEKIIIDRK